MAYENAPFTPPAGVYLRAYLLPAKTTADDLAGAHRAFRGVFQVSIHAPINQGPGVAAGIADEIAAQFPVNLRLTQSGVTVQVVSPASIAPALQEGDRYIVPVSFQYRADTI